LKVGSMCFEFLARMRADNDALCNGKKNATER
jgi:hypothetical protein